MVAAWSTSRRRWADSGCGRHRMGAPSVSSGQTVSQERPHEGQRRSSSHSAISTTGQRMTASSSMRAQAARSVQAQSGSGSVGDTRRAYYTARPMSSRTESLLSTLRDRGFIAQISDEAALSALLAKGRVTFYCGFDPTGPSLHVGSMVPLMAMAHLARAGHRPIGVLGGGTAMIGDPSGKTEMRQLISAEMIEQN